MTGLSKGVDFARWVLDDEHGRTMRHADSMSGLSEFGGIDGTRSTPTDFGATIGVGLSSIASSAAVASQQQQQSYSQDNTWRIVLMGFCGGTILCAGSSFFILGVAGRSSSFTNLLDIHLTPKQSRLLLCANFATVCFAGVTVTALISWFSAKRRAVAAAVAAAKLAMAQMHQQLSQHHHIALHQHHHHSSSTMGDDASSGCLDEESSDGKSPTDLSSPNRIRDVRPQADDGKPSSSSISNAMGRHVSFEDQQNHVTWEDEKEDQPPPTHLHRQHSPQRGDNRHHHQQQQQQQHLSPFEAASAAVAAAAEEEATRSVSSSMSPIVTRAIKDASPLTSMSPQQQQQRQPQRMSGTRDASTETDQQQQQEEQEQQQHELHMQDSFASPSSPPLVGAGGGGSGSGSGGSGRIDSSSANTNPFFSSVPGAALVPLGAGGVGIHPSSAAASFNRVTNWSFGSNSNPTQSSPLSAALSQSPRTGHLHAMHQQQHPLLHQPTNLNVAGNEELPLPNLVAFVPHALRTVDLPHFGSGGGGGGRVVDSATLQFHPNIISRSQPQSPQTSSLATPMAGLAGGDHRMMVTSAFDAANSNNNNMSQMQQIIVASSPNHASPHRSSLYTDSDVGSPFVNQRTSPAVASHSDAFKWWDNVTAATCGTGTVLTLHICLGDLGFSGPVLGEAAKADIDSVSRLVSIALEMGDSYGAVIDSFNLEWVTMSFNVLRPCLDHEKAAAHCAVLIRNKFLQVSATITPQSSPAGSADGSPLTNPTLKPLVPFSIGIDRGVVLGGHVGHGTVLRSFVLYGTPVERSRDLALLGSTSTFATLAPILCTETFNDLIGGASCSSLVVDFVEFAADATGKSTLPSNYGASPVLRPQQSPSSMAEHGGEEASPQPRPDASVAGGSNANNSSRPSPPSGKHRCVVGVFDLFEEIEDDQQSPHDAVANSNSNSTYEDDANNQNNNNNNTTTNNNNNNNNNNAAAIVASKSNSNPRTRAIADPERSPRQRSVKIQDGATSAVSTAQCSRSQSPDEKGDDNTDGCGGGDTLRSPLPVLRPEDLRNDGEKEEEEEDEASGDSQVAAERRYKADIMADYLEAMTLMRRGSLDQCLRVCARLHTKTILGSSGGEGFVIGSPLARRPPPNNNNNNNNYRDLSGVNTTQPTASFAAGGEATTDGRGGGGGPRVIPMWLFQIKRHLARLRRSVQGMFQRGMEGQSYVRHNQSRWAIVEPDVGSIGGTPLLLRQLDPSAFVPIVDSNNDNSGNNSGSRSPQRDGSLDMTIRSLNMTSRSLARRRNLEDSPTRLIAALQAQATAPTPYHQHSNRHHQAALMIATAAVAAAAAAGDGLRENSNDHSAAFEPHQPSGDRFDPGRPTSASNNYNSENNNNNGNGNGNNNNLTIMSPLAGGFAAVPDLFQDMNGTWYRRSTKVLGRGAFGEVCLGIRPIDGILVAMKTLSLAEEQQEDTSAATNARRRKAAMAAAKAANGGNDVSPVASDEHAGGGRKPETKLEKIVSEVLALAKLRNNNVVSLLGCAVSNHNVVLLLEFVSGGSLENLLQNFGTVDIPSTQRYLKDILRGLRFIHEKGVVHRDIKVANVLMHIDGSCKLADLGSSIALKESVKGVAVQGTPYYMSPEAARGAACFASDIWSVGIVACQLVSNLIPLKIARDRIEGQQGLHRLLYHLQREVVEFDFPDAVLREESLHSFVMQCLKADPKERATAEQLLMHPFLMQQFKNRDVVSSASPSASRRRKLHPHLSSQHSQQQQPPSLASGTMAPVRVGSALEMLSDGGTSMSRQRLYQGAYYSGSGSTPHSGEGTESCSATPLHSTPDLPPSPVAAAAAQQQNNGSSQQSGGGLAFGEEDEDHHGSSLVIIMPGAVTAAATAASTPREQG